MTGIKNIASIAAVAALALTAVACGSNSTSSSSGTPTPAQTPASASAAAQGSAVNALTSTGIPTPNSSLSVAALCQVALSQDTAVNKSLGSNPDATTASNGMNVLGDDLSKDALANNYGDPGLNVDLTTFGSDALVLSTALSTGLPPSSAYAALTDAANTVDTDCGYPAGTF